MDEYFFRADKGTKAVGPLSRQQFEDLQARGIINENVVAWRTAGGNGYKIQFSRKFRCDREHVCNCHTLFLIWEAVMIIAVLLVISLLFSRLNVDHMLKDSSLVMKRTIRTLMFLSLLVLIVVRLCCLNCLLTCCNRPHLRNCFCMPYRLLS